MKNDMSMIIRIAASVHEMRLANCMNNWLELNTMNENQQ